MAVIRTERRNQLCLCFAALAAASLLSTVGIIFSGRLGNPTKELREGSTPIPTLNLFADRLSFTEYRQPRALETRRSQTIRSFMSTSVGFHMPLDPNATTIEVNANRLVPTGATNETTPKTSSQCKLQNCMDNKDKLPTPVDFQTPIHPRSNTTKVNASRLVPTGSPPPTNSSKTSPQCKQQNCLDFLSTRDKQEHSKCLSETRKYFKKDTDIKPSSCNFLPDRSRRAVALASPEGSGNTWLRELLETATGVCTGFCCCDPELRVLGFPGEGITSGSVLVVKTHIGSPQWFGAKKVLQWEGSYGSAVFLVRNPARALIAEWNRRATNNLKRERHKRSHGNSNRARLDSHTYAVSEEEFRNDKWRDFAEEYLGKWFMRLNKWVFMNDNHPVHVVSYEDLKNDTVREVEKILDFLHFPYSHEDLIQRLRVDFTTFQRHHMNDGFQHFSPEQKERLRLTLKTTISTAKKSGKEHLFHFNEYLESLHNIT